MYHHQATTSHHVTIEPSRASTTRHPHPLESSSEDEQSYGLFLNDGGICGQVPPRVSTTTLYRSGSVSIINCEYKLKEKYPHLGYLIFFFIIYLLLILLGASLFVLFEAKAELRLRDQILNKQHVFLEQNPCVDRKELKQFIQSIISTNDKGVNLALLNEMVDSLVPVQKPTESLTKATTVQDNQKIDRHNKQKEAPIHTSTPSPLVVNKNNAQSEAEKEAEITVAHQVSVPGHMANWEFSSSLTYVASVVTTIGYGHVKPITTEGKVLTIVFGAIAIPSTLLFFSVLISIIRDGPIKTVEVWIIKLFTYCCSEVTLIKIRFFHLVFVTLSLFSFLILLPAFLFDQMEPEWTFLDSFYYCFITITTVGLGDYVPGQNGLLENRTWYLVGIVLYMYIGLCMMMLWIALVLRIPYFNFKTFLVIEDPEIRERKLDDFSSSSEDEGLDENEKKQLIPPSTTNLAHHQPYTTTYQTIY